MSDPVLVLYDVSAETPNQAGQVLADFAEVVRIGIDPGWPVMATAVAMTHASAGRMPDDSCLHGMHPMRAPA
jgi:hypothetical protein